MLTIETVLDTFEQLSSDEQAIITDLIVKRRIESQRAEISRLADESLQEYKQGIYTPKTAKEGISELKEFSSGTQ